MSDYAKALLGLYKEPTLYTHLEEIEKVIIKNVLNPFFIILGIAFLFSIIVFLYKYKSAMKFKKDYEASIVGKKIVFVAESTKQLARKAEIFFGLTLFSIIILLSRQEIIDILQLSHITVNTYYWIVLGLLVPILIFFDAAIYMLNEVCDLPYHTLIITEDKIYGSTITDKYKGLCFNMTPDEAAQVIYRKGERIKLIKLSTLQINADAHNFKLRGILDGEEIVRIIESLKSK